MTEEPVRRAAEIEDFSNLYFIHPVANRLTAFFAAIGVRPNAVSLAGMGFGILAGIAYAHYRHTDYAVAGFVLMIAWHVMDGADGQLARLTRKQSHLGKILDGICDYVTFIAVYAGLALALSRRHGDWGCLLILASGACHAVQSALYEAQRQEYNTWGWGRTGQDPLARDAAPARGVRRIPDLLHRAYVKLQLMAAGPSLDHRWKLAVAMREPERAPGLRQRYRDIFAPTLRRWSILSANTRTLAIFICVLFKAPLYFFWFESIGLSLVAIILLVRLPARYALFFRGLGITEAGVGPDREPKPSAKAAV